MNRRFAQFVVLIFCVFVGSITLISGCMPDKKFSEMENRNLQLFPEFTVSRWKSGRFMEEMEDYISDHVIFRDQWVGLKSAAEAATGKKENNGVYFGDNGTLINRVTVEDEALLWKNVSQLETLSQNVSAPVYFGLIPSAAEIWREKLPAGAVSADEAEWIQRLYENAKVESVDFVSALEAHDEEPVFYRTDHHWTSLGAYYGANAILATMEMDGLQLSDYDRHIVSEAFYGTIYSSSGAWWTEPDQMEYYIPEEGKQVMSNFSGKEEVGQLYNHEKLEGKNKYTFFLGGNQPHCVIRSDQGDEKLLLIRDSYADSLVPFLSERFGEVHMFDLRYNRMSIKEYVEEQGIDRVLVLYSFSNYIEDTNQFLLAR